MANDPVLSLHRVEGNKFELSGLRTGSVRDQLLRAQIIVERLHGEQTIGPDRPLLVCGGGAAGIGAAVAAIVRGVDVVVLELNSNPFSTQLGVTTRNLNPTEFDWPQPHWLSGRLDWSGQTHALPYATKSASALAREWTSVLRHIVHGGAMPGSGLLQILQTDARQHAYDNVGTEIELTGPASVAPVRFGAALSCIGFSGERTSVRSTQGTLTGPKFWSTDSLARGVVLGHSRPIRALVSGGGDGAQQDFLRLLTGTFGTSLYLRLGLDQIAMDLEGVMLAESFALRAHAWSTRGRPPERVYAQWQEAYTRLADDIWAIWSADGSVARHRNVLRSDLDVTWVIGGQVPGFCYGLNRLLTLLVARLHAADRGRTFMTGHAAPSALPSGTEVVLAGFKLDHVEPLDGHRCDHACYAKQHHVFVTGDGRLTMPGPHDLGAFDLVVVRHGVDSTPLFDQGAPFPEQLVPMDIPW